MKGIMRHMGTASRDDPDMSKLADLIDKVRCCSCSTEHIEGSAHVIMMDLKATWSQPTWTAVIATADEPTPTEDPTPRAITILCDNCVNEKKMPLWAVELRDGVVIYHDIKELEIISSVRVQALRHMLDQLDKQMEPGYLDKEAKRRNMGFIPFQGPN